MKRFYKILRSVIVTLIVVALVVPAALYVALSLPSVQQWLCRKAESELSSLLTVAVDIDYVQISPFNRVSLHNVSVADSLGKPALKVQRLGAGLNFWSYLFRDRIVVDYAELIGMEAKIYRDSAGAPLNIQPIINALKPKDRTKPPTKFDFRINTVVIRTSAVQYDVYSEPHLSEGFDPNHIAIKDLRADLQLPQIKNDDFIIDLRRLAFNEQSGFALKNLSGLFHISDKELSVKNLTLALPRSKITINDQKLTYNGFEDLKNSWKQMPFDIHLMPGSHLATTDLEGLLPQLATVDMVFDIHLHATGDPDHIDLHTLRLSSNHGADISLSGSVYGLADTVSATGTVVDIPMFNARFNAPKAVATALRFAPLTDNVRMMLTNLGDIDMTAKFSGDRSHGDIDAEITSSRVGAVTAVAGYSGPVSSKKKPGPYRLRGEIDFTDFSGASLMDGIKNGLSGITDLDGRIEFDITRRGKKIPDGNAHIDILEATIHGQTFTDLSIDLNSSDGRLEGSAFVDNSILYADAQGTAILEGPDKMLDLSAEIHDLNLAMLGIVPENSPQWVSFQTDASLSGHTIDDVSGNVSVRSFVMRRNGHPDFTLDEVSLRSVRGADADTITLESEIADACVSGRFHLSTLPVVARSIIEQTLPALTGEHPSDQIASENITDRGYSNLNYNITVKDLEPLTPLASMPVKIIEPVTIGGRFNSSDRSLDLRLSAPYLLQGKKLIENTSLQAGMIAADTVGNASHGYMNLTTTFPTKKGAATVITTSSVGNDKIDSHIEWRIDRERDFSGDINISALFSRDETTKNLRTDIRFNPSQAVFNDTVWTIDPSQILIEGKEIAVNGFRVWRDRQSISIGGKASENPDDTITLALEDINLDYVFETLDIQTAMFGGNATGKVYATRILTGQPEAFTPGLSVRDLTYNYSLLGDALLRSEWDNNRKAVSILAEISQRNGRRSFVDGEIFVTADSLDMNFDADKLEIGFLKPFMSAFASDIKGYASGKARLWGSFKLIDMVGDIYGEDVALTLGFTQCTYTTTDSVKLRPGRIDLNDITLHDANGHQAKLNGVVTHKCFKEPRFDFRITEARDLLVYDVKENSEHPWYGRVYGNGGATITGAPGIVDISVSMSTAANSAFTFVLSDALSAQDYKFITFRDRDQARKDSIAAANAPSAKVLEIKRQLASGELAGPPSIYKMNFTIDITPQALITLVMDPVGGDRIKAYGSGVLRMSYDSANEDLRMNGTYTVDRGNYNFTLQDIIIKDFTINPGSSIAFHGDPYAAQLDLTAKYQVKANLTDLDESFLEDKELNRTNVPVDALLIVKGDMRQPDISFDIDLPTLTSETKRKVRSIINTEEMMNRQIIYLLALNRFYTPDYMNATRGNEFVSVASSTISSQLSNMLGQLSDNWAIAPNFRSDRGDFSDMEFDLALSSHLLNNRLLLNGNLGYRDKSMNNNSFIGDFDIEYLLNRSGSFRLKAYNRYNDQNYYFKSALTTQGVGIMFKRDFDSFFSFLRPLLHKKDKPNTLPADTTTTSPTQPTLPTHDSSNSRTEAAKTGNKQNPDKTYSDFLRFR